MSALLSHRRTPLPRGAIALLLLVAACSSWRTEPVTPTQLIQSRQPRKIRIERVDGTRLVLAQPFVRGDTVAGTVRRDTVRIAESDISRVAVRRFSWLRTGGLVVGTSGAALGVLCLMACGFSLTFSAGQ
jgi:hypothetical protein